MDVCIRCSRSRAETNAMSRIPPSGANDRALSHQTHSLLQTAGFVCPSSVASRSVAAHRAVASATSNTPRRKPSCLQQQRQQEQQGWRAGARGGSEHVLGARRRDDFFDDDDDDLYDDLDLDDRFSAAPQKRKRPKVPLLPATLSKVSSLYIHIPSFYYEAWNVAWVGGEKRRRLKRCGPVRAAVGCGKRWCVVRAPGGFLSCVSLGVLPSRASRESLCGGATVVLRLLTSTWSAHGIEYF